jgi:hypothetical protein
VTLNVPVTNPSPDAVTGTLQVELLGPAGTVVASETVTQAFKPGSNAVSVLLAPKVAHSTLETELAWYRVRYKIMAGGFAKQGTVALASAAHDLFAVRMAHPRVTVPGGTVNVRVHTANPVTLVPVGGVHVHGKLTFGEANPVEASRATNSGGDAVLTFKVPANADDDGEIEIEARKGAQERDEDGELKLDSRARIVVNTDKLLYQPGQSLHVRALMLGPEQHAVPKLKLDFSLIDPQEQTFLAATAETNEFGIASVNWDLPDTTSLGDYTLHVEPADSDTYEDSGAEASVKVSRYDLPNFTVSAKPDRSYYLPYENADIEISAKYLFGKELTRGKAKLVRRENGHWDSAERKYVYNEAETKEADLDHNGSAKFHVDLAALQDELARDTYKRFQDLDYAAFVTDPTTGRTEQRRFTLRLSRNAIHVYVSSSSLVDGRASFYLSTYYPDGTPAACDAWASRDGDQKNAGHRYDLLRTFRTNRYGVARIQDLPLPPSGNADGSNSEVKLHFDVRDKRGRTATYEESFGVGYEQFIQVTTDKAIYASDDAIAVSVRAPMPNGHLVLEAANRGNVLWTGNLTLHHHQGFAVVPYLPAFSGEIVLAAYSLESGAEEAYEIPYGAHAVLYPHPTRLNVQVKTDRVSYKPGEDVSAALKVSLPGGGSSPGALGVVVVDKAVEERVRTDEEFHGSHYGFWDWSWWNEPASAGGVSREDLDALDPSSVSSDMQLVSEVILNGVGADSSVALPQIEGSDYAGETRSYFQGGMMQQLKPLAAVINAIPIPT